MKDACYLNGLLHALPGTKKPLPAFSKNKFRHYCVKDFGFQDGNRLNIR
jgi:hypothetical protein